MDWQDIDAAVKIGIPLEDFWSRVSSGHRTITYHFLFDDKRINKIAIFSSEDNQRHIETVNFILEGSYSPQSYSCSVYDWYKFVKNKYLVAHSFVLIKLLQANLRLLTQNQAFFLFWTKSDVWPEYEIPYGENMIVHFLSLATERVLKYLMIISIR